MLNDVSFQVRSYLLSPVAGQLLVLSAECWIYMDPLDPSWGSKAKYSACTLAMPVGAPCICAWAMQAMAEAEALEMKAKLEAGETVEYSPCNWTGQPFALTKGFVSISKTTKTLQVPPLEALALPDSPAYLQGAGGMHKQLPAACYPVFL